MIASEDEQWLALNYPGLVPRGSGVVGTIDFAATYNQELDRFLILSDGVVDDVGGVRLSCRYGIQINERQAKGYSGLPAVHVDGLDMVDDRHFSRIDNSACLCSPLEEKVFLQPFFDFRRFLEQLVIPFLYGQSFFSENHCWPWKEYAHGATGLLESFDDANIVNVDELREFLGTLALDLIAWQHIRAALQRGNVKGHTSCFCPKKDHIRRCHPKALAGLRRLQLLVKELSILPF